MSLPAVMNNKIALDQQPGQHTSTTGGDEPRPYTPGVAAIVLAAGRSERMGAFKPLLPFGKTTVIDSCIEHLREGGVETIVVVVAQDARGEKLQQHLNGSNVTFAVNPNPASEMGDSIAYGVRQLSGQTRAVLITPADHPAVPAEVVVQLIEEWQRGAQLIVPTFETRGGHPVLLDIRFRAELLKLDPQGGLKKLFQIHFPTVSRLAVESKYIARDMDTWDDYRVLHEEVFGVSPSEPAVCQHR